MMEQSFQHFACDRRCIYGRRNRKGSKCLVKKINDVSSRLDMYFGNRCDTNDESIGALNEQLSVVDEVAIELYEMEASQEEINNAQDEALIELYELIGG